MPNAHVFVVDVDSYPVHRDRLFCGVKNPNKTSRRKNNIILNPSFYGLYADLKALRIDDIVFFYQMRKDEEKKDRGFRGIFKIKSEPFFDNEDIAGVQYSTGELGSSNKKVLGKCSFCNSSISDKEKEIKKIVNEKEKKSVVKYCQKCNKELDFHILPNRVLIEPITLFKNKETGKEAVIDDNTAYIDRDYIKNNLPILWTMLFRKVSGAGRERSITHILPEEANKLKTIFEDLFEEYKPEGFIPYEKPETAQSITIPLECDKNGELKIEALLEAWMMENIDKDVPVLKDVIGHPSQIEYFGNNVLYGIGGEKVDVLVLHNNGVRYKATVMELKKSNIKKQDVLQIKDYTRWMAQLVFGDSTQESKAKIQPVLIGFNTPKAIIDFAKNFITETRAPIILNYKIVDDEIKFERVL